MRFPKTFVLASAVGTAFGAFVLFKDSTGGAKYEGQERIAGRTVIITGANSGIGKETCENLAKRGGRIIMACHDMEKCEKVKKEIAEVTFNTNLHCRKLDLASMKSIREFAENINKSEKRIDISINNAGVMQKERTVTEDGFETNLGVNFLGHFLLTNLLLDKIVSSAPSRIINVGCIGYDRSRIPFEDLNSENYYNPENAYKQSKLAVVLFTVELARRLQDKKVTVNVVNPGVVNTDIRRHYAPHKSFISSVVLKPIWVALFKTPVQGCQTILYAALEPSLDDKTGQMLTECQEDVICDKGKDKTALERLWLVGEKWTRLK